MGTFECHASEEGFGPQMDSMELLGTQERTRKNARRCENGTDGELGNCQSESSQFPFFPWPLMAIPGQCASNPDMTEVAYYWLKVWTFIRPCKGVVSVFQ